MAVRRAFGFAKQVVTKWQHDKAPQLGAALAYYTAFSLAPLLVVVIAVAGLVFGEEAAAGQIVTQIRGLVGNEAALAVEAMVRDASRPREGIIGASAGIATLLLGATGVFGQLKAALNSIWDVEPRPGGGILRTVRQQFFSFTMVLGTGFLLLVSLVVSATLSVVQQFVDGAGSEVGALFIALNFTVSIGIITLLFAMIFRLLPDTYISWSDVWAGAAVTAVLFTIGKELLGVYIGHSGLTSTYGAAASLAVILVWIYYASQILFLGAEFTQVYSRSRGSHRLSGPATPPPTCEE